MKQHKNGEHSGRSATQTVYLIARGVATTNHCDGESVDFRDVGQSTGGLDRRLHASSLAPSQCVAELRYRLSLYTQLVCSLLNTICSYAGNEAGAIQIQASAANGLVAPT